MKERTLELDVEVALLPSTAQKRSNYRPNHKHPLTGDLFLGEVMFQLGSIAPGTPALAQVRALLSEQDAASLLEFGSWTIWEGPTHVGSTRILGVSVGSEA